MEVVSRNQHQQTITVVQQVSKTTWSMRLYWKWGRANYVLFLEARVENINSCEHDTPQTSFESYEAFTIWVAVVVFSIKSTIGVCETWLGDKENVRCTPKWKQSHDPAWKKGMRPRLFSTITCAENVQWWLGLKGMFWDLGGSYPNENPANPEDYYLENSRVSATPGI